jgi:hypothetical protein
LPVCDRPILEYGIANLVAHDVTEIVFNLHHKGDVIRRAIRDGARLGARVQYVDEPVILGTGGGLKNARAPIQGPRGSDTGRDQHRPAAVAAGLACEGTVTGRRPRPGDMAKNGHSVDYPLHRINLWAPSHARLD